MNLKIFLVVTERKAAVVKEIQEMCQVLREEEMLVVMEVEKDYSHLLVLYCPLIYSINS